MGMFSFRLNAN